MNTTGIADLNTAEKNILNNGDKVLVSNENVGEKIIPVSKNVSFQDVHKSAKIKIDDGRIVLEVVKHISIEI